MGHLISITKVVFHAYAKNGDLQYSFLGSGDYKDTDTAKKEGQKTCEEWNAKEDYKKYTFGVVRLYGECPE